ncbi:phage holin family protein [Synoicihabitans lomoniglobus]|uniref:Phage holin family protein n=1 Tax=Synoicihabitans lomoniglobus TaxID=2909285 RepID=A0AAE9ZV60_9BACT|nr:phage holin family protein [Opitutaceae bacterium LMO-M01]WED64692.1 phage holin family protein [Opitutaceae bacterium LMO-M01]
MVSPQHDSESDTAAPSPDDDERLSSVRIAMRALDHRARLAALEFREARSELMRFSVLAIVAIGALQLAAMMGLAALMAATWDTEWRVWAPIMAAVGLAGGGVVTILVIRWRAGQWMPFGDVLGQVSRDAQSLHALFNPPPPKEDSDG